MIGISTNAIVIELISQIVILLFLYDNNASLLVVVPMCISILIQAWKVSKAVLKIDFSRLFTKTTIIDENADDKVTAVKGIIA